MDSMVCIATGSQEQFRTLSPKVVVLWDSNKVYCGFRTGFKVILTGMTVDTMVKIYFQTDKGELLDEIEVQMDSVVYVNKVLIPFNVAAGTNIYIEIQVPEYGLVSRSDCKPVYNSIPMPKKVSTSKTRSVPNVKSWTKHLFGYLKFNHQPRIPIGPLYPPLSQIRHNSPQFAEQQI